METAEVDDGLPDKYIQSYFARNSRLNGSILTKENTLSKYFGNNWNDLPQDRKELLLDFLLVDDKIRNVFDEVSSTHAHENKVLESFPRLYLNSGQKINVDFESDVR